LKKIPVYILTGFLGSGKTTVLRHLLQQVKRKGLSPGLVLNELGEVNDERHLFQDLPFVELLNGCICCTIKEDLTKELFSFMESVKTGGQVLDILFIEGTGVANPIDLMEALAHPSLVDEFEVQSVISLVDASRFLEYQSVFSSSREIRSILKEQITGSSLILLNKLDLVPSLKLDKVKAKLINMTGRNIEVIETEFGQADVERVLKPRMQSITVPLHRNEKVHHHEHHHAQHPLFQTIKIENIGRIHRRDFEAWFKEFTGHILRAKGIIQFKETKEWFQFQFASNQLHISPLQEGQPKACVILIGTAMPIQQIVESLGGWVLQ
jgi:G3E family GTPase